MSRFRGDLGTLDIPPFNAWAETPKRYSSLSKITMTMGKNGNFHPTWMVLRCFKHGGPLLHIHIPMPSASCPQRLDSTRLDSARATSSGRNYSQPRSGQRSLFQLAAGLSERLCLRRLGNGRLGDGIRGSLLARKTNKIINGLPQGVGPTGSLTA